MTNEQNLESLLAPYQPKLPLPDLVVELNRLYHRFEAAVYDDGHPEIHGQLPPVWAEMVRRLPGAGSWRVLDFGCGTGFEAQQLLHHLGPDRIERLVCYDISPAMLERCRSLIGPRFPRVRFTCDLPHVLASGPYNLLATNSLLHHLPDPVGTLAGLAGGALSPDSWWLGGHEPSRRYYANPDCCSLLGKYERERRWRKYLRPANYWQRVSRVCGWGVHPASAAAKEAQRRGCFARRPPAHLIGRLVDYYVAHSEQEARSGRGLDYEDLARRFTPRWKLDWVKTYAFLGPHYEAAAPDRWRGAARELARQYPLDGANFCCVWRWHQTED